MLQKCGKGMTKKRVRFDMRIREHIIPAIRRPQLFHQVPLAQLRARHVVWHLQMGNQYYAQKLYADAIREYTHSLDVAWSSHRSRLYESRAACYWMLENYVKCCDDSLAAIQFDFKCYLGHTWAGRAYLALGRLQEARQYLTRAQELNPREFEKLLNSSQTLREAVRALRA